MFFSQKEIKELKKEKGVRKRLVKKKIAGFIELYQSAGHRHQVK
jgi:hypothetical protein